MERLTIKPGICANASTEFCESQEDCYSCPHGKEMRFRLSAYEDTGLMPEEYKAQPRWISVTDRLPEYGQYVLLVAHGWNTEYGDIYIGRLKTVKADDGSGNFWGIVRPECEWSIEGWSYFRTPIVTHWMPLPEPPKEERE